MTPETKKFLSENISKSIMHLDHLQSAFKRNVPSVIEFSLSELNNRQTELITYINNLTGEK